MYCGGDQREKERVFSKLGDQRIRGGEESDRGICHKFPTRLTDDLGQFTKKEEDPKLS